jgi:hypothetical protein
VSHDAVKTIDGFPIYQDKHLRKVNALRMANSQPLYYSPVIPTKGQVLFTTSESMNDEPSSCYNCQMYNETANTCMLIGSRVPVRTLIYPKEATADAKPIEYWPCCSMQLYGDTNKGEAVYKSQEDPDYLDLVWINAPKVGQEYGGANCGGCAGGDDCDHYLPEDGKLKWESLTGFCRALQTTVACGDICTMWRDDDELPWREAVQIIREQNGR